MTRIGHFVWLVGVWGAASAGAQEGARFEMPVTVSGGYFHSPQSASAPRFGSAESVGVRMVAYPAIRLSRHWSGFAAIQMHTRPYFHEQLATQGCTATTTSRCRRSA